MKARHLFDAIGVVAAAAVVIEQAVDVLGPFLKNAKVPAFVPAIVRDIPGRTANAFEAFTTSPASYERRNSGPRAVPMPPGQRSRAQAGHRPAPAGQRIPASA